MDTLTATGGMLIRRPLDVVREAFVDPAVTTRFWFTESTGRLEPGAVVRWTWAMYGVATQVRVHANEANRILVEWDTDNNPTEVEWLFSPRGADTFVEVENRGFAAGDTVKAMDSPWCWARPRSGSNTASTRASSSTGIRIIMWLGGARAPEPAYPREGGDPDS
jgi:uncharacterized protein YndB with AHSA1/START domain